MKQPIRFTVAVCASLVLMLTLVTPALAAQQTDEEKERAKQARIEEYLRKKEERRARREMEKQQKELQKELEKEQQKERPKPVPVVVAEPEPEKKPEPEKVAVEKPRKEKKQKREKQARERPEVVRLPRALAQIQEQLRATDFGQDPTVRSYLDLIDRGEATPQQLAAFGNFLSQNGMTRDAIEYYGVALSMEKRDPLLWMNVGTLHRKLQELSMAATAYGRALSLDPNNAFAHYNLGSVLDEMGKYKESIEEYKLALTLDPTLGDPVYNPAAANNDRLLAVKLMLYGEEAGSLGLPLVDLPGGGLEAEAENEESDRRR
jgi:tetratricopeptide (TPR) repeat protein